MTNFDKLKEEIKDMTPEEFVGLYDNLCDRIPIERCNMNLSCGSCILEWLKCEVN